MTTKIEKIVFTLGERNLELTLAEAQALRDLLTMTLGNPAHPQVRIVMDRPPRPMPHYYGPQIVQETTPTDPFIITCVQKHGHKLVIE